VNIEVQKRMSTICSDVFQDAVQVQEMCGLLDRLEGIRQLESKAEGSQRIQEFKELVSHNKHIAIIQKLASEIDFVLMKGSDVEILNYFAILISLSLKIPKGGPLIQDIITRILDCTEEKTTVLLQVLVDMYNVDVDATRKYTTLLSLLNYARQTNQGESLLAQFQAFEDWEKELNLTLEKRRELCLGILPLFKSKKLALPILFVYLKSFENESGEVITGASETIHQLVLDTIKSDDLYHCDVLHLKAIKAFEGSPFYKLVETFCNGTYKSFKEYFGKVAYLSSEDFNLFIEKMKILTITSVLSARDTVPFSEIAEAIEIEEDDVEAWIVDAASRNLIVVKMDQPQRQVVVKYLSKRSFQDKDWISLGNRVNTCRENINSLLETVRRAKQAALYQSENK